MTLVFDGLIRSLKILKSGLTFRKSGGSKNNKDYRVLFLCSADENAPGTRFRCSNYFSYLSEHGYVCTLRPFIGRYLSQNLYRKGGTLLKALFLVGAVLKRFVQLLFEFPKYDLVFLQREAMLFGPPVIEWIIVKILRKPMIFDYDDAIFVPYASPFYGKWVTWLKFPEKTRINIRLSKHVIAGNAYLRDYALKLTSNITIVPSVVNTDVFTKAKKMQSTTVPIIGWSGSLSTTQYFKSIMPMLKALAQRQKFILKVIGASEQFEIPGVEVINKKWALETDVSDIQSLDIGLYPVLPDAWSLGKCGLKAVQYMACGVVCVASPVGVLADIIQDEVNGFWASNENEWIEKLTRLIKNETLRKKIAEAGRQTIEDKYSLMVHSPRILDIFNSVLHKNSCVGI